jgi:hypothetical protein
VRPVATPTLIEAKRLANKMASHLTYERFTKYKDFHWRWIDIQKDLREIIKVFVAHVPPQRIEPKLRNFMQFWLWTDNLPPP